MRTLPSGALGEAEEVGNAQRGGGPRRQLRGAPEIEEGGALHSVRGGHLELNLSRSRLPKIRNATQKLKGMRTNSSS